MSILIILVSMIAATAFGIGSTIVLGNDVTSSTATTHGFIGIIIAGMVLATIYEISTWVRKHVSTLCRKVSKAIGVESNLCYTN